MAGIEDILKCPTESVDFYKILGCDETSTTEQINAEYKIRALQLHPDKNAENPDAGDEFKLIQMAKDTLTNPESRKNYDTWRNSGLTIPFDQWLSMKDQVHVSMHWAVKKKKDLMLENEESTSQQEMASPAMMRRHSTSSALATKHPHGAQVTLVKNMEEWQKDSSNEVLRKFRNYEI